MSLPAGFAIRTLGLLFFEQLQAFFQVGARAGRDAKEPAAEAAVRFRTHPDDEGFRNDGAVGHVSGNLEGNFEPGSDRLPHRRANEESAAGKIAKRAAVLHAVAPESH